MLCAVLWIAWHRAVIAVAKQYVAASSARRVQCPRFDRAAWGERAVKAHVDVGLDLCFSAWAGAVRGIAYVNGANNVTRGATTAGRR